MEKKLKELNEKYRQSINLAEQAHNLMVEFLNESVAACGGTVELTGYCKTYEEADEAGIEFDSQFPAEICITDKHGFNHSIYITRLFIINDIFYIDGYDYTDGEWIKGWYVTHTESNYSDLAYFVKSVIAPEEPEKVQEEVDENTKVDVILVGYQVVDSDRCYPSEFGCWDVFRAKEDAEEYCKECLDPEEYTISEEWATPQQSKMYHYHARVERSFKKGEIVWIKGQLANRFAVVTKEVAKQPFFNMGLIHITEFGRGGTDRVEVGNVYQPVKGSVCPKCGEPLYRGHWNEDDGDVCIHCDRIK